MTRTETRPHYPHLPYRECGGAGAGEMARMTDNDINPGWGLRTVGWPICWTIARIHAAMYRTCRCRAALAEWLGTGLPSRSQEFDPPRPLQRRHPLIGGHVRGVSLRCIGRGASAPTDEWQNSSPTERHSNGDRHVLERVTTYPELTR